MESQLRFQTRKDRDWGFLEVSFLYVFKGSQELSSKQDEFMRYQAIVAGSPDGPVPISQQATVF